MSGDRVARFAVVVWESGWSCAQRKAMAHDTAFLMTRAAATDPKFKKSATTTNAPSGKSASGQGWVESWNLLQQSFVCTLMTAAKLKALKSCK